MEFNTLEQYVGDHCFQKLSAQRVNMGEYLKQGQAGDDPTQWTALHTVSNRVCFSLIPTSVAVALTCVPYVLSNWPPSVGIVQDVPTVAMLQADEFQIYTPPAPPPGCDTTYPCMGPNAVTIRRNELAQNESAACCAGYACGGTAPNWYTPPSVMQCMDCSEVQVVWNAGTSMFEVGGGSSYGWAEDAVAVCVAHGIPPSTPPPTPPPPPPSPPKDGNSYFNDPDAICGGGCIGAVGVSTLLVFFGLIYYFNERVKKAKVPATVKEKEKKEEKDGDADDADDGGDGGD